MLRGGGVVTIIKQSPLVRVMVLCVRALESHLRSTSQGSCQSPLEVHGSQRSGQVLYTGFMFVAMCAQQAMEPSAECLATALYLYEIAWVGQASPPCTSCPVACALALVINAAANPAENTEYCSRLLFAYLRARQHLLIAEKLVAKEDSGNTTIGYLNPLDIRDAMDARRLECASLRREELKGRMLPPPQQHSGEQLQFAILVATNHEMLHKYQPFINLWRCYSLRHGYTFILDTDDANVREQNRAWNWLRWLAVARHLPFYNYVMVVDPDQFVIPQCWGIPVAEFLAHGTDGLGIHWDSMQHRNEELLKILQRPLRGELPDVIVRDVSPPQTLNNGVVLLRNSARGRYFLELLLEKVDWALTIQHDQGAFDETVLEVLGLELDERRRKETLAIDLEAAASNWKTADRFVNKTVGSAYDSQCMPMLFPSVQGEEMIALYALCWWSESERLAGRGGQRRSDFIHFIDPRVLDINHVVGVRGTSIPAFIYHFAGRSKDWDAMLHMFGLPRRSTADCSRVFAHVEAIGANSTCIPGNRGVEDLFTYCEPPLVVC